MTIEEVRALIATPMKNEAVKQAYLFSSSADKRYYQLEVERRVCR